LDSLVAEKKLETGDHLEVDFLAGRAHNLTRKLEFSLEPMSQVQRDIFRAGDLFAFGRASGRKD
jgi:hypothetical protein